MRLFADGNGRFGLADMLGEIPCEGFFGADAFEFFHQPAVLVEQYGGRTGHQRMTGSFAGIEHVDIGAMPVWLGRLAKNRPGPLAGGAMFVSEIKDYWASGFQGFAIGGRQSSERDIRAHQNLLFSCRCFAKR